MNTNVQTGQPGRERDVVAEQASHAYALHRMGEALRDLPDFTDVWVCIQPGLRDAADENRARVDAVAQALFGQDGKDEARGREWKHDADGMFGPIRISITAQVPGPPDERDAEIERLRAELAAERTAKEFAQSHLGTEGAVSQPKPDTQLTEYTGRAPIATDRLPLAGEFDLENHSLDACRVLNGHRCPECQQKLGYVCPPGCPIHTPVPDMQTRPRCSPDCLEAYALKQIFATQHLDGCPNGGE